MKKTLSAILILVLLVLPLSACRRAVGTTSDYMVYSYYYVDGSDPDNMGNDENGDNETHTTSSNSSEKTGSVVSGTTTQSEYEGTKIEGVPATLKNPKITLVSWYDPGSEDKTTAFYYAYKKYEELYGKDTINLILTSGEEGYRKKIVSMIASNDTPDLMEMKTQWMPTWAINNIVSPIDGLIDYENLHYQGLVNAMTYKGKHYVACPNGMWATMIWYNKSLFDKYGVTSPMEYYKGKDGGWTWENFRKASKEIKDASNGSVYGFSSNALDVLIRSLDKGFVVKNSDGTYKNNMNSPDVKNALQTMYEMIYKDKSWNPDLTAARTQFAKGKIAMSASYIGFYQDYCKGLNYSNIEVVPTPKPSKSADYHCSGYGIFWSVGKDCGNLDGAAAFMKILAQYEDTNFGNRTPLEQVLTDSQLELTRKCAENGGILEHLSIGWDPSEFWREFSTGNVPVATIIAEYTGIVDAAIGKLK